VSEWLSAALDFIPRWLEFQIGYLAQTGCAVAIAERGRIVLDQAFGIADLATGERLTPRHRFRVASHSKSFTAAGILKLHEEGRLRIDDPVGKFVADLHPAVAAVSLAQLLSHSAGVVRDGVDAGYFMDRHPFLTAPELLSGLAAPPMLAPSLRFKYSNYGFGLLGLVIAAVTGEAYTSWIRHAIIAPAGLEETAPDIERPPRPPFARGHSGRVPLGRRVVIPGENASQAMAAATGFVSTARDLALFFSQLDPESETRLLSPLSRREMARRLWRDRESALEQYYGLGLMSGKPGAWEWFGHAGMFQGYISGTRMFPREGFTVSVLTNAVDSPAQLWLDGIAHILETVAEGGAAVEKTRGWSGRWWTLWGAMDLVPMGDAVRTANPALFKPFEDGTTIAVTGQDSGRLTHGSGFRGIGETVRLVRDSDGTPRELWFGGVQCLLEHALAREMTKRYEPRGQGTD
jgi:CubicO group peptidase (beta-lactamase class C family)